MSLLHLPSCLAQLSYAWPGLVKRRRQEIEQALAQVTPEFLEGFRKKHPRAKNATIYRINRHELQLRGMHSGDLSVHWIDHPRLIGLGISYGQFANHIEALREQYSDGKAQRQAARDCAESSKVAA